MPPLPRLANFLPTLLVPVLVVISARAEEPNIAARLQPFVDSHTLAGAVTLVASADRTLSLDAVGYADVAARTPMKTDCLFWIASMSKPMTAAALMMLVDEGKVKLDDPVEKYLPEFRGQMVVAEQAPDRVVLKKPAHPITVREVLSHTSGIPFMSRVQHKIDSFPLDHSAITYALTPLKFEPGSKYDYSNAGINTAGRIIEVVSGMPYEDFVEKRLFQPLGMKDTTFWPSDEQMTRLAKSYRPDAAKTGLQEINIDQLSYPLTNRKRGPCPAGGYFATASDVALFGRLILGGGVFEGKRLLSESSVRELTSTQTGALLNGGKGEGGYGLGFSTSRKSPGESGPAVPGRCGHGGAYATDLAIDPQRHIVTVFMVQHAGYPGPDGGKVHPTFLKAAEAAFSK
ncbi:MAG: estB 2 [Planctomycetota bacterium]|nr:estB 2 [Planctomycetota bacterium]